MTVHKKVKKIRRSVPKKMRHVNPDRMTIQKWYGYSLTVPSYGNHRFAGFAMSCVGLVRSVFQRHLDQKINVYFNDSETASADQDRGLIYINRKFLTGDFGDGLNTDSDTTLSGIMGIIVHETAHFVHSPKYLDEFSDYVKRHSSSVFNEKIAKSLGNVVEDVYIEAKIEQDVPVLFWMLEAINDIIFPEDEVQKAFAAAENLIDTPKDIKEVLIGADVCLMAKVRDDASINPFADMLFNLTRKARRFTTLEERKELTLELYDILMENITEEQNKESESDSALKQLVEALLKASQGTGGHEKGKSGGRFDLPVPGDGKQGSLDKNYAAKESVFVLNGLIEKYKDADFISNPFLSTKIDESGATALFIELDMPTGGSPIQPDIRYAELAAFARQRATVNRPYGLDSKRGHTIRKLYRIAEGLDGKIFAEQERMNNYKPMEVVIIIDNSGSMNSRLETPFGGMSKKTRIEAASEAALGAANALTEGRSQVAVYAHTADVNGLNEVILYKVKDFNEPLEALPQRFGALISESVHNVNRDGYAYQHMATKFKSQGRKRLLIVISDGQPYAENYSGTRAVEHGKEVIDSIRSQGIEAVCISITKDAQRANDGMFGSNRNYYNEDPNVIHGIVEGLLRGS